MAAQLEDLGIEHQFFKAVDTGRGEAEPFLDRVRLDRRKKTVLTSGDIGCFASNVLLWRECVRINEPIAVLEDDLGFHPEFPVALRLAETQIRQGYPMIRLFGFYPWRTRTVSALDGGFSLVRYLKGPKGTQCQVYSPEGARRLLKYAGVWAEPLDFYIDRYWVHGVQPVAITPYAVDHLPVVSEVGIRPEGAFTVRRRLLKTTDSARRRLANARFRIGEMLG